MNPLWCHKGHLYLCDTLIHVTTRDGLTATVVCVHNKPSISAGSWNWAFFLEESKPLDISLRKAAPLECWRKNKNLKISLRNIYRFKLSTWYVCLKITAFYQHPLCVITYPAPRDTAQSHKLSLLLPHPDNWTGQQFMAPSCQELNQRLTHRRPLWLLSLRAMMCLVLLQTLFLFNSNCLEAKLGDLTVSHLTVGQM